jgi:4-hydroxybenzoate polyprenyltransferase
MMTDVVSLMRIEQWVKNIFVFLPLFFSGKIVLFEYWLPTIVSFVAFSLAASSIYALNDVVDAEADRNHPQKRCRPIAAGNLTPRTGLTICVICALCAFMVAAFVNSYVMAVVVLYLLLDVAYCLWLKRIAILDVLIVAVGFVLRLLAGGWATAIHLSQWIVMMTFLLALFLVVAKRRDDVLIYERQGTVSRDTVYGYNLPFVNQVMCVVAAIMIVCYIMYTVSPEVTLRLHTNRLYLTTLFVIAGVMRYMQLTLVEAKSSSPTKILLNDRFVQLCVIGWFVSFMMIIYL